MDIIIFRMVVLGAVLSATMSTQAEERCYKLTDSKHRLCIDAPIETLPMHQSVTVKLFSADHRIIYYSDRFVFASSGRCVGCNRDVFYLMSQEGELPDSTSWTPIVFTGRRNFRVGGESGHVRIGTKLFHYQQVSLNASG